MVGAAIFWGLLLALFGASCYAIWSGFLLAVLFSWLSIGLAMVVFGFWQSSTARLAIEAEGIGLFIILPGALIAFVNFVALFIYAVVK